MLRNSNETPFNEPPRHGWGGDLHKRDAVLKDRAEEAEEKKENANKFAPEPKIGEEDYRLLHLMEKDHQPTVSK